MYELGTTVATTSNRVYVTLRLGKITESSKEPRPGFFPAETRNNAGDVHHFFAKTYDDLTGYVKEINWYQNTLDNGTVLKGWKVLIDVGEDRDYVLDVGSKQRPFNDLMTRIANADFTKPVRFRGFTGKDGVKVLLLTQEQDEHGKPIWLAPAFDAKYLSRFIIDKLKAKTPLTEDEERNIARDEKGKILPQMKYDEADGTLSDGYPYIFQNASDAKWNFSVWTEFLIDKTLNATIPRLAVEVGQQPVISRKVTDGAEDLDHVEQYEAEKRFAATATTAVEPEPDFAPLKGNAKDDLDQIPF